MINILELNQIHLGDCLDVMKEINSDSIDLTVTSPPYDNLRTYNNLKYLNQLQMNCIESQNLVV